MPVNGRIGDEVRGLALTGDVDDAPVSLSVREGMRHAFSFAPDLPEGRESLDQIADFVERALHG